MRREISSAVFLCLIDEEVLFVVLLVLLAVLLVLSEVLLEEVALEGGVKE